MPWSLQGTLNKQTPALLSESPALLDRNFGNGGVDDGPFSVWDGDDMTLEMVTDVNDGDVDEDVRALLLLTY